MNIFMTIFSFFGSIFGYVLYAAFSLVGNFGVAIIIFTIIMKAILFPFSLKQQKSMAANARIQAKQKELKEKYGNNKQKYNEEVQKLYEQEKMSPMSGCSTSILPMIVMLGIYYSVVMPITNTLHINSAVCDKLFGYCNQIPGVMINNSSIYSQIDIIKLFSNDRSYDAIRTGLANVVPSVDLVHIRGLSEGFNFLGLDLLSVPKEVGIISWAMLIPVLCLITSIGSQIVLQRMNGNPMANQQGCMKYMMYLFPLITAYIAYSLPCAVGFYWICSTVISFVQSFLLNKYYSPAQITAKSEAQHVALLELKEANVKYNYQPATTVSAGSTKQSKKK